MVEVKTTNLSFERRGGGGSLIPCVMSSTAVFLFTMTLKFLIVMQLLLRLK
jgi:hypothetical protein